MSSPASKTSRSARRRLAAISTLALAFTGVMVIGPVTGGIAEEAKPVSPAVQDIALGTPDAPAPKVDVVPADETPAPSSSAEKPKAPQSSEAPTSDAPASEVSPSGSATPPASVTAEPQTTDQPSATPPNATGTPSDSAKTVPDNPAPKDELNQAAPMPVPSDAQVLVLDKTQTKGFSSVGISWLGDAPVNGLALQIRVLDAESGVWSKWTELTVNRDVVANADNPNFRQGSDPFWFGTSDGVEVAVTVMPGTDVKDIKLTLIDPKQVAADSNAQKSAPTSSAGAATPMPPVYSRKDWGADESKMKWAPQYMPTIKAATLHHSADSNNYSASDVPGVMRSIYQYQAVTLGWGDIGYNVVVDKFGRAWEGRTGGLDKAVVGAHAGGFNQYTFGVSMLGNYDLVDVPAATREMVAQLIAWKFSLFGVNPGAETQLTQTGGAGTTAKFKDGQTVTLSTIFGHRQTGYTVCPGQYGYAILPQVRSRAQEIIAASETPYNPEGALAASVDTSGKLSVNGWLIDRSAIAAPVNGAVTVDGVAVQYFSANGPRPELAYYGIPGNHGFAFTTTIQPGTRQICLYASNIGAGESNMIDCKTVNYQSDPIATIGALAATGNSDATVSVNGWAYDGNAPSLPVVTVVTTNGKDARYFYANGPRPELANYGMPGNHGFNFTYGVPTDGAHKVCMYTVEIDNGVMNQTDCKTVTVSGNNPRGYFSARRNGSSVTLGGWAFDPSDLYANTVVMVTVNGNATAYSRADRPFADLAYYGVPGNHGFATAVSAPPGASICLFVMNVGNGADALVQCSDV